MQLLILFIYIFILSCAYPDIDSVPDFTDLKVSEQESVDLCKLSSSDSNELIKCLVKFYELQKLEEK